MKLRIGDIEVQSIVELEGPFRAPVDFIEAATDEAMAEHRELLEPWALDPATGKLIFKFQSYLVRTPNHTALIDTCIGCNKSIARLPDWHQRQDQTWLNNLRAAGVEPAAVDYVFCTHMHVDHVGWNTQLADGRWTTTFPNARYVFARTEYEAMAETGGEVFEESVLPVMEAGQAILVDMDHALDDNLWLEPTPGHTPGHVAVKLASNGASASMCGDLIHAPVQCLHPDWSPRVDYDPDQAHQTRRRYMEQQCESAELVLTAHFPTPSTGRFVPKGDAFWFEFDDNA